MTDKQFAQAIAEKLAEQKDALENQFADFEAASGAGSLDLEYAMKDQWDALGEEEIDEISNALSVLTMFYEGTYAG